MGKVTQSIRAVDTAGSYAVVMVVMIDVDESRWRSVRDTLV